VPFRLKDGLPRNEDPLQGMAAIAARRCRFRDYIDSQTDARPPGATLFVCDFAFGTISHEAVLKSVECLRARCCRVLPMPDRELPMGTMIEFARRRGKTRGYLGPPAKGGRSS